MSRFKIWSTVSLLFLAMFFPEQVWTQCPECTPDVNCTSTDGLPNICPAELPSAVAGEYYEQTITFFLPATVIIPESEITATLLSVTINSISGLPFGMEATVNDPDATYYPSEGENLGCATICGTPILAGIYNLNIAIHAEVEVSGFEVPYDQSFFYTFIVDPGSQENSSFTFDNQAGCGEVVTQFEAILNLPAITTYYWDFGNGQTSEEQFPPSQTYNEPGDYTVSLTTTVSNYFLNSVNVNSLDDNWTGDVDDFLNDADVWFTLTDGDGSIVFTSSIVDNDLTPSWEDMLLQLGNPPYYISFTDDDLISQDDGLGNAFFDLSAGTIGFDTGSGTSGFLDISLAVTNEIVNEETITVFPLPEAEFEVDGNLLSYSDPELTGFVWLLNGEPIDNVFGPTLTMVEGGLYSCFVTNLYGCSAMSSEYLFCPSIAIVWDELNNQLFVEDIYESYQWFFNGLPLEDETTYYISNPENGNYSIEVETDYGCSLESDVITVDVSVAENAQNEIHIYPNPAHDIININASKPGIFVLYDLVGNIVMRSEYSANTRFDISSIAPGVYFVQAGEKRKRLVKN